jgi:hypothetical protein
MLEIIILLASWIIGILLFYFLVPASKFRLAILGFLIMQTITWPLGFLVSEFNFISYPVRLFDDAARTSFTFEYFAFPIVGAMYNLYYPRKSKLMGLLFTSIIVSLLTGIEVILERYTDNIEYINWRWYWSWISMFITLYISLGIWKWFIEKSLPSRFK